MRRTRAYVRHVHVRLDSTTGSIVTSGWLSVVTPLMKNPPLQRMWWSLSTRWLETWPTVSGSCVGPIPINAHPTAQQRKHIPAMCTVKEAPVIASSRSTVHVHPTLQCIRNAIINFKKSTLHSFAPFSPPPPFSPRLVV